MQHTVSQDHLQIVHESMRISAQLWVSGLITDQEVAQNFAHIASNFKALEQQGALKGLIDPATGLSY